MTADGSHPSTCLTICLLWEQIMSQSLPSSHLGIFCTGHASPLGCALRARVGVQINIHLHLLQRLGSVSVTNTSPLGHKRGAAPWSLVHLLYPGELEGNLKTPPAQDHRVTLRQGLAHSLDRPAGSRLLPTDSHPSWTQLLRLPAQRV